MYQIVITSSRLLKLQMCTLYIHKYIHNIILIYNDNQTQNRGIFFTLHIINDKQNGVHKTQPYLITPQPFNMKSAIKLLHNLSHDNGIENGRHKFSLVVCTNHMYVLYLSIGETLRKFKVPM